jgi:hypothetical protein
MTNSTRSEQLLANADKRPISSRRSRVSHSVVVRRGEQPGDGGADFAGADHDDIFHALSGSTNEPRTSATQFNRPNYPIGPLFSEAELPPLSCADNADTRAFAGHNPACQGNCGRATSAYRNENKTEQKWTAEFLFVLPFKPPTQRWLGIAPSAKPPVCELSLIHHLLANAIEKLSHCLANETVLALIGDAIPRARH